MKITIGKLLLNYRNNRVYTSEEMAQKLGINRSTYSLIENDHKNWLRQSTIRKIAELLSLTPDYIVSLLKGGK